MRRGVCLVKDCPHKHHIPTDNGVNPVHPQAYMFGRLGYQEWGNGYNTSNPLLSFGSHAMFYEVSTNKNPEGKVCLDTGANEVVRNYSPRDWANIDMRQPCTRKPK